MLRMSFYPRRKNSHQPQVLSLSDENVACCLTGIPPCPLNAVSQVSEHQQEAIFPRGEPNPYRTLVRTLNTQEAADQESEQREMEKRLHEAKLSGTGSNPAVNEIHPRPRVEGRTREGAVDRRSKASSTHLPCNPLEPRTPGISRTRQRVGWIPLFDIILS